MQRGSDDLDVVGGNTETGRGKANLLDKVADTLRAQVHVPVDRVLRGVSRIGGKSGCGAAEQDAEILVQVRE